MEKRPLPQRAPTPYPDYMHHAHTPTTMLRVLGDEQARYKRQDPKSQSIRPKSQLDSIKEGSSMPTPSFNPPPPPRELINELPGLESLQPLQKELELINAKLSSRIDGIEIASSEATRDLREELELACRAGVG